MAWALALRRRERLGSFAVLGWMILVATMPAAVIPVACGSSEHGSDEVASGSDAAVSWPIYRSAPEGRGERIGSLELTSPSGGAPRPARVGTHGLRILFEDPAGGTGAPESAAGSGVAEATEVRVVYSREGAADTRSLVAVAAPGEPGVWLGTVELGASGTWRFRIRIVGGTGGSAQVTVPDR